MKITCPYLITTFYPTQPRTTCTLSFTSLRVIWPRSTEYSVWGHQPMAIEGRLQWAIEAVEFSGLG